MSLVPNPSQTLGPLYGFALMFEGSENMVSPEDPGAIELVGQITDGGGPVSYPEAMIEAWNGELWARSRTDETGEFRFVIRKPEPDTTDDGRPLAPHMSLTVFARGLLKAAQTRMYFPDEPDANAQDAVLQLVDEGERNSLVAQWDGDRLRFDICLQGSDETVFFDY